MKIKLIATIVFIFFMLNCEYKQPTVPVLHSWNIVKTFDREVSINELFVLEPYAWATGSRIDMSDPLHPQSESIWLTTSNNWENYVEQSFPISDLNHIFFITELIGWGISGTEALLQTEDGGINWEKKELGYVEMLTGINIDTNLTGWLSGYPTFRTSDGGETWVAKYFPNKLRIRSYFPYISQDTAFTTGSSNLPSSSGLYKTIDSGETWELVSYQPSHESILSFDTFDGVHIWYVDGMVLRYSEDGGKTFTIQDYYIDGTEIRFFDSKEGIIVGGNTIWRTYNGGMLWQKEGIEIPTEALGIRGFRIISQGDIWGWGYNTIFRYQ